MFKEKIILSLAALLPVRKRWVVFDNFCGKGYGDSPGAIAGEILRQKLPYKLFWLVDNPDKEVFPEGIKPIRRQSAQGVLVAASAKVWIDNTKNVFLWKKKKSQFYIQTWHGGGIPIKEVEGQIEEFLPASYVERSKKDSAQTDVILADNNLVADIYRKWFWYPESCEVLCQGLPKNDIFYSNPDSSLAKKKVIGRDNVKVALYAPTFRDDAGLEGYGIDLKSVHKALEEKTGKPWLLAVRLHPNISYRSKELFSFDEEYVIDVSHIPDPVDVIVASDILISDYSSIFSDFMTMGKPVFLLLLDHELFVRKCRSINLALFNLLPFPKCYSNKELTETIEQFDLHSYEEKVKLFRKTCFQSYDDGHSAKRIVERILQVNG